MFCNAISEETIHLHAQTLNSVVLINPRSSMGGSRRGAGDPDPPPPTVNHKTIGFLSNTGLDPLKITKLPRQHSLLDNHRHASETPFKRRVAGVLMMVHL